jgi:solute carrier family 39 (zinc transporter), member 7
MIAFATGGLMGDTFINLIPHAFLGEPAVEGGIQLVVVDKGRNVVVGVALFAGFALFFLIDKVRPY